MEHYMKYELSELAPCIKQLCEIFENAPNHPQQALNEKYKDAKFDCVSTLKAPTLPSFEDMDAEENHLGSS